MLHDYANVKRFCSRFFQIVDDFRSTNRLLRNEGKDYNLQLSYGSGTLRGNVQCATTSR